MVNCLAASMFRLECSTAMGKKSANKSDIEKTDGNSLMAKARAPKSLTLMTLSVHCKHFYGKNSDS